MRALSVCLAVVPCLAAPVASAQITIAQEDLQLDIGARRTFLTHRANVAIVTDLIKGTGGPLVWDFTSGVEDETYRYEILPAEESGVSAPFPAAQLVEELTIDSTGARGWTFYNLTAAGRELHGFHDEVDPGSDPVTQFDPPVVDYPATIEFLDQWSAPTSYVSELLIGGVGFPVDNAVTITSFVDAYGTLTLPNLGTIEVLRVNELSLFDSVADVSGTPFPLGQSYARSYLWLSKEYGLVAQITSEGGTALPPAEFDVAARFLRLTEFAPSPVQPVITALGYDPDTATATIACATIAGRTYQLEVSDDLLTWRTQGDPVLAPGVEFVFTDDTIPNPPGQRYYRVRRLD